MHKSVLEHANFSLLRASKHNKCKYSFEGTNLSQPVFLKNSDIHKDINGIFVPTVTSIKYF